MLQLTRSLFRRAGFDLIRYRPTDSKIRLLQGFLERNNVRLVFDVGANHGQWAQTVFAGGYQHRLVSFEPLAQAHQALAQAAASNPNWLVHPRCAVTDHLGQGIIHRGQDSQTSSILPATPALLATFPEAKPVAEEAVDFVTLDHVAPTYFRTQDERALLKLDVQGAEDLVLAGATQTLPRCAGLWLEAELAELYQGQALLPHLMDAAAKHGFRPFSIHKGTTDPHTGQMLAVDVLFYRA